MNAVLQGLAGVGGVKQTLVQTRQSSQVWKHLKRHLVTITASSNYKNLFYWSSHTFIIWKVQLGQISFFTRGEKTRICSNMSVSIWYNNDNFWFGIIPLIWSEVITLEFGATLLSNMVWGTGSLPLWFVSFCLYSCQPCKPWDCSLDFKSFNL